MKSILYFIVAILLLLSCYFGYHWFISEPENQEPLPALLSFFSSLIMLMVGWLNDRKMSEKNNADDEALK